MHAKLKKAPKSLASYGLLALVLGATVWLSWRLYADPPGRVVHAKSRELVFERHPTAYLVPQLDVKRRLAARWPMPVRNRAIPASEQEKTTRDIKEALYSAFVAEDVNAAREALQRVSWRFHREHSITTLADKALDGRNPEQWPLVRADHTLFNLRDVVEALDTTWLLSAFLLDRMGETKLARRFYSEYNFLLAQVEEPGASEPFFSARAAEISGSSATTGARRSAGPRQEL